MNRKLLGCVFAVFAVVVLAAVPLRVMEVLYAIDPATGFYKSGGNLITALDILLFVGTVLLLFPLLFKSREDPAVIARPSRAGAVISYLVAGSFLVACIQQAYDLFHYARVGAFVVAVMEVLSAVFFLMLGNKRMGREVSLALPALLPIVWGVVILIVSFMQYTTIASISEYLFDVLKMVFMLIFLYYNSMAVGRVENKRGICALMAFGLPAALFSLVSTVPQYIAYAVNHAYGSLPAPNDLLYLALTVYILFVTVEAFRAGSPYREHMGAAGSR